VPVEDKEEDGMKKITKIDKASCDVITGAAMDALKSVAEPYGVTVKRGRATYYTEDGRIEFKVTFALADSDRRLFESQARYYGLQAEDFGREFTHPTGKKFRIVGINPRARTRPIIVESDGKKYDMAEDIVKDLLSGKDLVAERKALIDAREAEGLKMKPGDLRVLADIRPKYLCEDTRVRILKVDKKKKSAEVEWADYNPQALKNTGPKFWVALGVIVPVPSWLEGTALREERPPMRSFRAELAKTRS
jgi:hypothetical protein